MVKLASIPRSSREPALCFLVSFASFSKSGSILLGNALIHPVPKQEPILILLVTAITSTTPKVFATRLDDHTLRHLESHSLSSDHYYGFYKAWATGEILAYWTYIWSSSLKDLGEAYTTALNISNACDSVWHKAPLAKIPSFGFLPKFCSHVWGYWPSTHLNRFQSKAVHLINSTRLTSAPCSVHIILAIVPRSWQAVCHRLSHDPCNARQTIAYICILCEHWHLTDWLWDSLPANVLPPQDNPPLFKRNTFHILIS